MDAPDAIDVNEFEDRIRFENVSFGYSERIVLRDINFEIQRGQTMLWLNPPEWQIDIDGPAAQIFSPNKAAS